MTGINLEDSVITAVVRALVAAELYAVVALASATVERFSPYRGFGR